jgi:hypothetical protein
MTIIKILLLTAMTATLLWLLVRLLKEKHWGKTFFTSVQAHAQLRYVSPFFCSACSFTFMLFNISK